MENLFITETDFSNLMKKIGEKSSLYAPRRKGDFLFYEKVESGSLGDITLGEIRPIQSLKSFLISPQERVSQYFAPPSFSNKEEKIILGAKSCDLESLKILDSVYSQGDFEDPFYIEARKSIILISSDCTEPAKTCFCVLLGVNPYPKEGFDLNLSPLKGGFIVKIGTDKGENIIEECKDLFREPEEGQIEERDKNRANLISRVKEINRDFDFEESFREIVKDSLDSRAWEEVAEPCVDCAGCNHICPTCRCFLLFDKKGEKGFERTRLWDGCLYTGFARVAAGANPRSKLSQRFANRLLCKFDFFPENIGLDACTGCGRCISVCIGKIDMREAVKKVRAKSLSNSQK